MLEFLKYENIYLHYGNKLVLKNISGCLKSGEFQVLSGENGAGKTSLLKILSGKLAPNRGLVSGAKFNREGIKTQIGISCLYTHLSVRENLEIFSSLDVSDVLDKFKLREYADVLVRDLSQGYVQRVNLSVAFSSMADLIILDEPTNFLDSASKELLFGELGRALSSGKSIFISSHEPDYFVSLNPKYLNLKGGQFE